MQFRCDFWGPDRSRTWTQPLSPAFMKTISLMNLFPPINLLNNNWYFVTKTKCVFNKDVKAWHQEDIWVFRQYNFCPGFIEKKKSLRAFSSISKLNPRGQIFLITRKAKISFESDGALRRPLFHFFLCFGGWCGGWRWLYIVTIVQCSTNSKNQKSLGKYWTQFYPKNGQRPVSKRHYNNRCLEC